MESFANSDINEIMKIEGNNKCIDCLAENPTFASINNAVFLCENCANIHKRLGTNISIIKSLTKDEFTPEEISILKIGGNKRFNDFVKEYGIKEDQNKEFKYHLKLAEYYRLLLLTEINKEKNPNEYEQLINNKPNPEIGLQIMESITTESIKQANLKQKSEFSKDVSSIASKIGSLFSSISKKVNDTAKKYGISQKFDEARLKINEGIKNFGENHPSIKNAADKTGAAFKTARNYTADALNKVFESETFKNVSGTVNNKYSDIMNSETMNNLAKKTEEGYINLKKKAGIKSSDESNIDNNIPQEQKEKVSNNGKDESINNEKKKKEPKNEKDESSNNEEQKKEPNNEKDESINNEEQKKEN